MRLQSRLLLILASLFIVMGGVVYYDSNMRLKNDYLEQENKLAVINIKRVINTMEASKQSLIQYTNAWSQWDEAYHFMVKKSDAFATSNFVPGTFISGKINFFLLYDAEGHFYFGKAYDLVNNEFMPIPEDLLAYLNDNPSFVMNTNVSATQAGIIPLQSGNVLLSSLPIITGDGKGPIHGSLLMGYYFTEANINAIAKATFINIKMLALPRNENDALWPILNTLKTEPYVIQAINPNFSYGYFLLNDIGHHPLSLLRIDLPRTFYSAGIATVHRHYLMIFLIGIAILITTWLLLKKFIVDRIMNVSEQISTIYTQGKFDKRIRPSGKDEINTLILSINSMLELIELTQEQLKYRVTRRTRELEKISALNRNLFTEVGQHKNAEAKLREDEKLLKKMAYYDTLTGLPNRAFFFELLLKTLESAEPGEKIALLFIDVDHFKRINDTYGHDFGDHYLKHIAERMQTSLCKHDISGRLAGDEMIVALGKITDKTAVNTAVARLLAHLAEPMTINKVVFNPAYSIGISMFPDDGTNIEELLRKADIAMYHAKKTPGNAYRYYSEIKDVSSTT
ncbi:MAG TPA: diguanylate cyclase [Gammaproteobacteria bacterium]|nr:diguanylate cyclase [Gammaproteobacteria bacterium]